MIAADVAVVLPDDFLVKVDRASMAHGLEVRPPLLDHELLELAAPHPVALQGARRARRSGSSSKRTGDRLPDDVLRRPKQGFEMPIDAWLRGPLRPMFEAAVLDPHGAGPRPHRPVDGAGELVEAHQSGLGGTATCSGAC